MDNIKDNISDNTSRMFLDVFPTLKLKDNLKTIMKDVTVTKITRTSDGKELRIFLTFNRLVPRAVVDDIQTQIKRQIDPLSSVSVRIIDRFDLPSVYNIENIIKEYTPSFLRDLENKGMMLATLFKNSEISVLQDDNQSKYISLEFSDDFINHSFVEDIKLYIVNVMSYKFGFDVEVKVSFKKMPESRESQESRHRCEQLIEEISSQQSLIKDHKGTAASDGIQPADKTVVNKNVPADKTVENRNVPADAESAGISDTVSAGTSDKSRYSGKPRSLRYSDDPDVLYGRDFDGDVTLLSSVIGEMGDIIFRGQVFGSEYRELRSGKYIYTFNVTDFTDSIQCKMFLEPEQKKEMEGLLSDGMFIKVKGVTTIDSWSGQLTVGNVNGIRKISDFREKRMDRALNKRVELHCHTKMSEMDAVSDVADILKQADSWGHKALAITDHGNVQAFTGALHAQQDGKISADFKIIYGVEGYLADDLRRIIDNSKGQSIDAPYVAFDLETTGLSPVNDRIIEIGAVRYENGKEVGRFMEFVNPEIPIPFNIEELTHINDSMVENARTIEQVLPDFIRFCDGAVMVAHNAQFDVSFIKEKADKILGLKLDYTVADTVNLARALMPELGKYTLDNVAKKLNVVLISHHRAVDDSICCGNIYEALIARLKSMGIKTFDEINDIEEFNVNSVRKGKTHHVIILAKNETGRVNLYRLISMSHLKYFSRHPIIPKSELNKHREGLIVGSACSEGELYQELMRGVTHEEIARIVSFYDYLEIQPIGNNRYLVDTVDKEGHKKYENIKDNNDLIEMNKRIVQLGEDFGKPVVATCDVHFLNPEDELYRKILMKGQGFDDADSQPPLYLRTTEEMLDEFMYLGEDKAYEVVVTNTNLIADMIDRIEPVRPDKCPPVIPNSDETLREICYNKAYEIYGPKLPEVVSARLERELNSIISNGYSVMYIIAQKLVWKSNEDGYLVGSRGSVGSSFAATMAGITEVNPLSPHYLCPNCYYVDFDSDEVKAFAGGAGCDMPDKNCPKCGKKLKKDGFDIPFETFLGFKGNKEPDIDLNFSGEYQAKAHAYTEVIFGAGQTYKAGTVGSLQDKTVYGYVKKYFEEKGIRKRECEINRIIGGCLGVKRSTGQHPGGIIVLPHGEELNTFTPVQHPANDMSSNIITTHFDYHSIDHNLLKLDILGHDDPTMIRMLQDLTGLDPKEIPLDSPEVMSLFQNTEALGITPDDIGGTKLGCLGIPEFGTDFAMQMLIDTKPKHFSDLVRIAGLSHGTDVWLGNAQTLILEGTATISEAICTRDDIMTYLIGKGIEPEKAFNIMEAVRKGKVAKGKEKRWEEWKEDILAHGVPEWYTWSCEKIQYMFPKAHAAAYVMMGWRVAYCKVFYPLAYYAAFYSIRADDFSYELMCFGKEKLDYFINSYKIKADNNTISNKEEGQLKNMRLVQEMYARGFEFLPIDLFKSHSRNFQIVDGKLLPPFNSIDGLGTVAADGIMLAATEGPFKSVEDFIRRTKVTKTNAELLKKLDILTGLPEQNQISLFDYFGSSAD